MSLLDFFRELNKQLGTATLKSRTIFRDPKRRRGTSAKTFAETYPKPERSSKGKLRGSQRLKPALPPYTQNPGAQ